MTTTTKIRLGKRQRLILEAIVRSAEHGEAHLIGTSPHGKWESWTLFEATGRGDTWIDGRECFKICERLDELGLVEIDRERREIRPTSEGRRFILGEDFEPLHTRYAFHPRKGWLSMEQNVGSRRAMDHADEGERAIETDSAWVPNRLAANAAKLLEAAEALFADRKPGDLYYAKMPDAHKDEFEALRKAIRAAREGDR